VKEKRAKERFFFYGFDASLSLESGKQGHRGGQGIVLVSTKTRGREKDFFYTRPAIAVKPTT